MAIVVFVLDSSVASDTVSLRSVESFDGSLSPLNTDHSNGISVPYSHTAQPCMRAYHSCVDFGTS